MSEENHTLKEVFGLEESPEEVLDEGFMDWLFGRWRGKFNATSKIIDYLERLYGMTSNLKGDYPVHVNRIRGNIKRIIMDLEDIDMLNKSGKNEKNRFSSLK